MIYIYLIVSSGEGSMPGKEVTVSCLYGANSRRSLAAQTLPVDLTLWQR